MQPLPSADMLVEVVEIPMPWWSQSHLDLLQHRRDPEVLAHGPLPDKMNQPSSPWTLPLPPPLPSLQERLFLDGTLDRPSDRGWGLESLEPAYVRVDVGPSARAVGATKSVPAAPSLQNKCGQIKPPPGLSGDPGLSGQRLKRVQHVKQAPIYKYSQWCAHWAEKGGRSPSDPMTPRSDLTKSEFDVQYGAWRKALVDGPPRGRGARILELNDHLQTA